ncbi:MAG: hypothetical protein PVSMB6_03570 [Steroidobacteraceae bacterium]
MPVRPADGLRLAFLGRLEPWKGGDIVLEVFAEVKKQAPSAELWIIGDGPERTALARRYRQALFTGFRFGDELASLLAGADVLAFPSLTDTFGLVMIEALACGVPVAAFPVPGPIDVIEQGVTGVLHQDLAVAITSALRLDRRVCASRAAGFSWEAASAQFLAGLAPIAQTARATVAVRRSSAMIAPVVARRRTSEAGDV